LEAVPSAALSTISPNDAQFLNQINIVMLRLGAIVVAGAGADE
jgi:hypothetical protein